MVPQRDAAISNCRSLARVPSEDYEALLFAVPGRFVDLQQPDSSLMLQKPGGYLEHGGGVRIDSRGAAYRLVADWIEQGAQRGSLAGIAKLSIQPNSVMDGLVGRPLRIQIAAEATDGTPRSIHRWLSLTDAQPVGTPNATVEYRLLDDALELTPQTAGYWPVTLRAGAQAVTVQLFVKANPGWGTTSSSQTFGGTSEGTSSGTPLVNSAGANALPAADDAPRNRSMHWWGKLLQRLGLSPAERCPPPLLARRLWLDLAGRHPSSSEWQSAIDDLEQGEIERLVDRLLESDEFAVRAGEVLANWGAAHRFTKQPSGPLANAIGNELLVSDNLQHLVRKMLLVPSNPVDPLTVFHRFASDPRGRAELIAATWLGVRVGCAQCHDHPLDHWTQDDYFAMAACWAEIETGADPEADGAAAGRANDHRLAERPRGGAATAGRTPGPLPATTTADEAWVAWLTDEANPQFSRNVANRIWAWLLGSGLVMDVDDHRATNPAVHAALLDHLAESLVASDFSLRSLVRTIVLSDCYARATESP
jgi:hypothetical protein